MTENETVSVGQSPMGKSWYLALQSEIKKEYFNKLMEWVKEERNHYTVYPPIDDVFSWTQFCPIKDVKVVILGQDPYLGPNQAHGLCFSVKKTVAPPQSLKNIFKELSCDIPGFKDPGHGDLSKWAEQGVLLLNAVLTVRAHAATSHKGKGWETFTDATIKYIVDTNCKGVVFMLWGEYAKKKVSIINNNKDHHLVLTCAHPSNQSAQKGFYECKHFSKANDWLKSQRIKEIDWCLH